MNLFKLPKKSLGQNFLIDKNIINKIVEIGNSKNVLKNPINSIIWLANNLAKKGHSLVKNSYISTGTCTPAIPIKKGDKIFADFGNLGEVKFNYV